MKNLFFSFLALFVLACNNNVDSAKDQGMNTGSLKSPDNSGAISGSSQSMFGDADSIEVYFYKDPANQKEFTRLFVTDSSKIDVLVQNLGNQDSAMQECPHDGKVFFYRNGDVFKTVYIATADTCSYLAYVINAKPYFIPMNDSTLRLVSMLKAEAR